MNVNCRTMNFLCAVLCALLLAGCATGSDAKRDAARLLDVFPASVVQAKDGGRTVFSSDFSPSGSLWAEGLVERDVFAVEMKHDGSAEDSFALRMGKGGQIYSLRGAFGESLPPSWRDSRNHLSPWNDEVWQFVAVCSRYNGVERLLRNGAVPDDVAERFKKSPYEQTFFIHNSGAYIPGESAVRSLYCPQLATAILDGGRTYQTVNWGLVPQVRTMHRSPALFYTQVRDAGDGVIELTWVVHNFSTRGDIVFDHLNAPWGGTRATSLPLHYVGSPTGGLVSRESFFGEQNDRAVDVRKTGGWNIASVSDADDSPTLALVYGVDKHREEEERRKKAGEPFVQNMASVIRNFRAHYPQMYERNWPDWQTRPANSFRNYDVIEMIPRVLIRPGASVWFRSYLVVNRRDRAVALAKSLVDKVDYGTVTFDAATTPLVPVHIRDGKVVEAGATAKPAFTLYSRPVPGTMPVFLIENATTGREVITTDPYHFVPQEPLDLGIPKEHPDHDYYSQARGYSLDQNNTRWKRLLGYGFTSKPATGSVAQLSTLLGAAQFPKPDAHHLDLWVKTAE